MHEFRGPSNTLRSLKHVLADAVQTDDQTVKSRLRLQEGRPTWADSNIHEMLQTTNQSDRWPVKHQMAHPTEAPSIHQSIRQIDVHTDCCCMTVLPNSLDR